MEKNITELPWLAGNLMSPECYEAFILRHDVLNLPCLQMLFSRLLGYAIILITSTFMKTPQIIKILKARSGRGVSFLSQFLMLVASSSNVAYSVARQYSLSLWGESIGIAVQTLVILLLILVYQGSYVRAVLFTVFYVISMLIVLHPSIPIQFHITMQTVAVIFASLSKVIQIWTNYSNHSTGQLSSSSIALASFRSFGRLVTLIFESRDRLLILNHFSNSVLNVVQYLQIVYYRKKKQKIN